MRRKPEIDALRVPMTCEQCRQVFTPSRNNISQALIAGRPLRFCSMKCTYTHGRETARAGRVKSELDKFDGEKRVCQECGRLFAVDRRSRHKLFCDINCSIINGARYSAAVTTGRERTAPHVGKTAQNMNSCFYRMRDPNNFEYTFRNLRNFVREHPELFPDGWAIERPGRNKREGAISTRPSRAEAGLRSLFGKRACNSWYDWVGVWKKDSLGRVTWERAA